MLVTCSRLRQSGSIRSAARARNCRCSPALQLRHSRAFACAPAQFLALPSRRVQHAWSRTGANSTALRFPTVCCRPQACLAEAACSCEHVVHTLAVAEPLLRVFKENKAPLACTATSDPLHGSAHKRARRDSCSMTQTFEHSDEVDPARDEKEHTHQA